VIVRLQDPRLLSWAGDRLGCEFGLQCRTIAHIRDEILAVVVYSHFSKHDCMMSIASSNSRWATRGFIKACFDYPFTQLGLSRVSFLTKPDNAKTIDLLERLNARQEGTIRKAFGDADGLLYGLLAEERRF
jgi:RimJ/RimL family protein N-acetyltransferase